MSLPNGLFKTFATNPVTTALGGALIGGSIIGAISKRSKSSKKKRAKTNKRKVKRTSRKRKYRRYARTAGKKRDRSTKRIRMTKNGQPYVILANGRARFIKKSSARNSRKRKGGKY